MVNERNKNPSLCSRKRKEIMKEKKKKERRKKNLVLVKEEFCPYGKTMSILLFYYDGTDFQMQWIHFIVELSKQDSDSGGY